MELVYLWVEKYKNIKEQGFNFSPRFKCDFDGENLTIEDKYKDKEYISIFPENINITAIVGENGSGKSSLLFQDEKSGEGFRDNFKIIFKNNQLVLFEPYSVDWDDSGPYAKRFTIQNSTSYDIEFKSTYDYLNMNTKEKQYFTSEPFDTPLSDKSSLYFNWDFLKYFSKDEYYNSYSYGQFKENPNILLSLISENDHTVSYKYFVDNINKKIQNFIRNHNEKAIKFFKKFNFKVLEIIPNENPHIDIFDLSNGERYHFLLLFILLEECFLRNEDLIIYLDEPDLTLHPKWQKELIKKSIEIFSLYTHKVQIIITSHSPFILSDIPKENVIFLESGKQVNPSITQTFGANIHTLLSHGFFMQDGLMGEFAKGKIEEIISFHKEMQKENINKEEKKDLYISTLKKKFWHIQSIIGDDYLKQVVKNHLTEIEKILLGKDKAKENEIKRLKAQIDLLEQE